VHSSKNAPAHEQALAAAKINGRALKMAAYGFFVSAPMNHVLIGWLQKMFAGKTTPKDRMLQLLASNVFIAPIQAAGLYFI
jgi:peroxisomal membrane protein 2